MIICLSVCCILSVKHVLVKMHKLNKQKSLIIKTFAGYIQDQTKACILWSPQENE